MSSDTQNRKKPNKKKRAPQETSQEPTVVPPPPTKPGQNIDTFDPKQRLRAHLNSMKKDRAKGSFSCEENANHDY